MRQDKLTTKLQEAISDAHSLAVGNDNQYIDPVHMLLALLQQQDGSSRSILQKAGPDSPAGAIAFSLPTSEVAGFGLLEE